VILFLAQLLLQEEVKGGCEIPTVLLAGQAEGAGTLIVLLRDQEALVPQDKVTMGALAHLPRLVVLVAAAEQVLLGQQEAEPMAELAV
jgi:hypothetical protein